jgi:hypothetical protein
LEFLRGIATVSVIQTTSLVAFPGLMENLSARRYSVVQVVGAVKSLLVQLEEMGLVQSLQVADAYRPMLAEMEDFLAKQAAPQNAHLTDAFAERLIALSRQLGSAVRNELASAGAAIAAPQIVNGE